MQRRSLLLAAGMAPWVHTAQAHHGWSSFDQNRPIYLEGTAADVRWRNPHVELMLVPAAEMALPADLTSRALPAQTAPVDGAALLKAARLSQRRHPRWTIELAPLFRMNAWQVAEIRDGDSLAVIGFTFAGEQGDPVLRVEYLWSGGGTYGLRSSPA
ncbi:DUF6152 family protein [Rubrivivax albus]|uniref:Uncharacterized protein n=1 Tax=Rubrivivax albus TaxID=2499835 RepID=A0A437JWS8_9BURK|nr:DUF6152 family protein [Rubrivivax albus]RVT52132.1 hypothetical protein ENE75_06605 [Rubrivivax albus]